MKVLRVVPLVLLLVLVCAFAAGPTAPAKPWNVELNYIEACSCDLFCPCYFNDHASHQGTGAHSCTFNNVAKVTKGKYGDVDLTGLKVWLSGDLGPDWGTKGQADWLVATFEPTATKAQRDAMMAVFTKIYPVKWKSAKIDESKIVWEVSPDGKKAHAKLENGKGEVTLTRFAGTNANKPSQIQNVRYFAADWNSPFDLYHSDHFYNGFGKSYKLHQANGFTITVKASGK